MSEGKSPNDLLIEAAGALPPEESAAHARRAITTLLQSDAAAAEPLFLAALAHLPRDAHGFDFVATAIREFVAQRPEWLSELRRHLEHAPGWLDAREVVLALAEAELSAGHADAALVCARALLERDPRDAAALQIAAQGCARNQQSDEALNQLGRWINAEPNPATLSSAVKLLDSLLARTPGARLPAGLSPVRVALLGNVTLNYLASALRPAGLVEGLHIHIHVGDFDQYRQELLAPAGKLSEFQPDAVIIALNWRETLPRLYLANLACDAAALRAEIAAEADQLGQLLRNFRSRSAAAVLVMGAVAPNASPLGFLDAVHERSLAGLFQFLGDRLAETVAAIPGVFLQQTDRLFSAAGKHACLSPKLDYLGRMPYSTLGLQVLARDWAGFVRQAQGRARKCLVLDLDNTLWGGIIGEDGLEGIRLGHDGIGRAFMDFQREVLRLHEQGVILALCSKNNEADALEVFAKHPDMVLKLDHFAAWRINWIDKPSNLKSLAQEINIGIDALVFLDDNPIERGAVRQLAPEVLVPELPRDPAEYPEFVRNLTCFATLQLTDEDLKRGQFYAGERQRKTLQESAGNLDDYLKALGMVLHITPIDDFTRPRIVQLIHRTNQFNLTTRRHSEVDVLNMTPESGHYICSIRLEDRYGDNGIVGVAILKLLDGDPAFPEQRVGLLDTLLMSCRILGRNVEKMFLAHLTDYAAERGAQAVIGEFIPSAKNQMVADFYPRFGFDPLPSIGATQRWALPVAQRRIERPPYIAIHPTLTQAAARG